MWNNTGLGRGRAASVVLPRTSGSGLAGHAGGCEGVEVAMGQLGQGWPVANRTRAMTWDAIVEATRWLYPQVRATVMNSCRSTPMLVPGTSRQIEENLRWTRYSQPRAPPSAEPFAPEAKPPWGWEGPADHFRQPDRGRRVDDSHIVGFPVEAAGVVGTGWPGRWNLPHFASSRLRHPVGLLRRSGWDFR